VRAQNEPVVKSHETAKKVGEQFGKSQATVRRGSSQGIQVMKCEIMHGVKMTPCKKATKPPNKLNPGFSCPAPKTTLEEKLYASKMNAHKTTLEEISNAVKMTSQLNPTKQPRQAPQLYYKC
jgi:hypothetical protein